MNTSYHRPTHTFEKGAYNATQVRLYGLKAPDGALTLNDITIELKITKNGKEIKDGVDYHIIRIGKNEGNPAFIAVLDWSGIKLRCRI